METSELKRQQERVALSRSVFLETLNSLKEAVFTFDMEGRLEHVNQAALGIISPKKDISAFEGTYFRELIHVYDPVQIDFSKATDYHQERGTLPPRNSFYGIK